MTEDSHQIPSAGFSITVQLRIQNKPGTLVKILQKVAEIGASLAEMSLLYSDFNETVREVTINCRSEAHSKQILDAIETMDVVTLISWWDDTLELHNGGKLEVKARSHLLNTDELSRAYTPGVARVCNIIHREPDSVYNYTIKKNLVAVVTDGSAVLGLGNIGPRAALPVMEGKAVLFKQFAGVDAFPICLDTQDTEEIISAVRNLAPVFGGINLEDISAPRCFEVEERLRASLDIPVFHDDQHGTAVVVLAAVLNALKLVGKKIQDVRIVVNGFGASGVACTRMLLGAGAKNIIPCDRAGIVYRGRKDRMNSVKEAVVEVTNPDNIKGSLADALRGADMFLGVSEPGVVSRDDILKMNKDPLIFALANPIPEIFPDEIRDIAAVIATGRSDYANQINNVLCFPGIFRGALDCRASDITDGMKIAAARAIADCVKDQDLNPTYIIPGIFRENVASAVASAVQEAAIRDGVARISGE